MRRVLVGILAASAVLLAPAGAAADPDAIVQRTIAQQDEITVLDLGAGGATLIGTSGLEPATDGFAFCPDGTLYGSGTPSGGGADSLVTIDPTTGAGAVVGEFGTGGIGHLACTSDGSLWAVNNATLFSVNRSTGEASSAGPTGVPLQTGLAADCAGQLFLTAGGASPNSLYLIADPAASSTPAPVGPLGTDSLSGIAFDPTGTTLWAFRTDNPNPAQSYTIDTTSGQATLVNANLGVVGGNGLAIAPLACPTPPEPPGPPEPVPSAPAAPVGVAPTFTG